MATVAARVADRRLLRLIRSFLTAGVLDNGLFEASEEGTPQGGPLSPLLSNLVLDELDRELERRGHRFVRYADDCNCVSACKIGSDAVSMNRSSEANDAGLKEVEVSAAVHLAFDKLQLADLAFGLPVGPWRGDCRLDR